MNWLVLLCLLFVSFWWGLWNAMGSFYSNRIYLLQTLKKNSDSVGFSKSRVFSESISPQAVSPRAYVYFQEFRSIRLNNRLISLKWGWYWKIKKKSNHSSLTPLGRGIGKDKQTRLAKITRIRINWRRNQSHTRARAHTYVWWETKYLASFFWQFNFVKYRCLQNRFDRAAWSYRSRGAGEKHVFSIRFEIYRSVVTLPPETRLTAFPSPERRKDETVAAAGQEISRRDYRARRLPIFSSLSSSALFATPADIQF